MAVIDIASVSQAEDIQGVSQLRRVVSRFVRNRAALLGLLIVLILAALSLVAPLIARYDPNSFDVTRLNQNPSPTHWLGTDYLGRDIWSRLLYGGRVSLPAGFEAVCISFFIGVPAGVIAGYGHKLVDDLIMRLVDMLLAVPGILLAIGIVTILGVGLKSVVIAVGIAGIPGYARLARGSTLEVKTRDFVFASISLGASPWYAMLRHILPSIIAPLVVLSTLDLSGAILSTAALSYLGLGTQPPTADWGTMLAQGYNNMFLSQSQVVFPGIAIFLAVLGVNLAGDGFGEALDPAARSEG